MPDNSEQEIIGYLGKVARTLFWGLLWIFANASAGLYFEMAFNDKPLVVNIIFYATMLMTLFLLLRYFYRQWRN